MPYDTETGAYVGRSWVTVGTAARLTHPDPDGPGAYSGSTWFPMTCKIDGAPAGKCSHITPAA